MYFRASPNKHFTRGKHWTRHALQHKSGSQVQVTYLKRRDRDRIVTQELYTGPIITDFIKD